MSSVRALVLTGFGINCDYETATAFSMAGAEAHRVHLNDLIAEPGQLETFHILAVPGGFSFGDDIASGRVLANRLRYRLGEAMLSFAGQGRLAIGICNGFQVLVKMGLLPLSNGALRQEVTLTHNDSARFEDRWVHLIREEACDSPWLEGISHLELPVRHGEGKFVAPGETVQQLTQRGQIALRYATHEGRPAQNRYPANPNGSLDDIAAICGADGRIFGLMPHPEAFLHRTNHPRWTRETLPEEGAGLKLFRNAVVYAKRTLLDPANVG